MGEGDGDVGEDGGGVGEDRGDDDVPAPPEARGREPPPLLLLLLLPWPSPYMGEGFHLWSMASMAREGLEPLRDWICLSVSICFCVLRFFPLTVSYIPRDP